MSKWPKCQKGKNVKMAKRVQYGGTARNGCCVFGSGQVGGDRTGAAAAGPQFYQGLGSK